MYAINRPPKRPMQCGALKSFSSVSRSPIKAPLIKVVYKPKHTMLIARIRSISRHLHKNAQ